MRARRWLVVLALVAACGKYGPPVRYPPQPAQAPPGASAQPVGGAEPTAPSPVPPDTESSQP